MWYKKCKNYRNLYLYKLNKAYIDKELLIIHYDEKRGKYNFGQVGVYMRYFTDTSNLEYLHNTYMKQIRRNRGDGHEK